VASKRLALDDDSAKHALPVCSTVNHKESGCTSSGPDNQRTNAMGGSNEYGIKQLEEPVMKRSLSVINEQMKSNEPQRQFVPMIQPSVPKVETRMKTMESKDISKTNRSNNSSSRRKVIADGEPERRCDTLSSSQISRRSVQFVAEITPSQTPRDQAKPRTLADLIVSKSSVSPTMTPKTSPSTRARIHSRIRKSFRR